MDMHNVKDMTVRPRRRKVGERKIFPYQISLNNQILETKQKDLQTNLFHRYQLKACQLILNICVKFVTKALF